MRPHRLAPRPRDDLAPAREDRPHGLSAPELAEYAPEIAFIGSGHDSAEWRFQQVREARILLCGHGPVLTALAEDGLRSGWGRLRVLAGPGDTSLRHAAERARRDDGQQVIVELLRPDQADDWLLYDRIADADLVVHVASGDRAETLVKTARMCADLGVALAQVLTRGADVWVTPVHAHDHVLAESGWRWLAASSTDEPAEVPWLTGPVPSLIAARVVLACFGHLTEMGAAGAETHPETRNGGMMTRIDLRNLDTSVHWFHRHPGNEPTGAADATATRDLISALRAAEPVTPAELLQRTRLFEDPHLGPLRSLGEDDLPQTPLALCRATVSDPYDRRPPAAGPEPVIAWGADREAARVRAVLGALATYRSLVAGHDSGRDGGDLVWGMDLLTGAMRRLPRPGTGSTGEPYPAAPGVAAGLCWDEAVEAGLLAHLEALPALREAIGAPRIDPVRESGDDPGVVAGVRLLEDAGEVFEFRDHTATVGLPAYSVSVRRGRYRLDPYGDGTDHTMDEVVARSVGWCPASALRHATEQALLSRQIRVDGRRWAANGSAPEGGLPAGPACARTSGPDVLAWRVLNATGRIPVAVPLVRDAADPWLPFVVQVVLFAD
jgi:hypothetical protein